MHTHTTQCAILSKKEVVVFVCFAKMKQKENLCSEK